MTGWVVGICMGAFVLLSILFIVIHREGRNERQYRKALRGMPGTRRRAG